MKSFRKFRYTGEAVKHEDSTVMSCDENKIERLVKSKDWEEIEMSDRDIKHIEWMEAKNENNN